MGVSKVVYDDETLIDLTSDTVTPETLLSGVTATAANGQRITGTLVPVTSINGQSGDVTLNYAGSSSAGGAATSANKLNTNDGSATQPVYFANGVPVKTTYTLGKSVPSDAKFTDTTYGVVSTSADGLAPKRDGSTTKFLRGDGTWAVPPDNNTTYGVVSTAADGLAPKRDGSTTKFLRADGTWAVPPDTNTDTNTTYTFATGDSNGQIKVTPSGGSAQNVSVKGLGTAAYTASSAYATAAQGTLASNALPKAGGTLTGQLTAYGGAAGTAQVRNVYFGTTELIAGSASSMPEGTMYFSYK